MLGDNRVNDILDAGGLRVSQMSWLDLDNRDGTAPYLDDGPDKPSVT